MTSLRRKRTPASRKCAQKMPSAPGRRATERTELQSGARLHVFILDGDRDSIETMAGLLEGERHTYSHFTDPKRCLSALASSQCDALLADTVLCKEGYSKFISQVKKLRPWLPVIVLADRATVQLAVTAFRNGASHFIAKPLDRGTFLDSITTSLDIGELRWESMPKNLTKSERLVLGWVLRGCSSTQIAEILGKSARTVEDQRRQVMRKLHVDNVVDLVKQCFRLGILVLPHRQTTPQAGSDICSNE